VTSTIVPGLIDTAVLLAWTRGHPPASYFFLALNRLFAPQISRLSVIELLRACQSDAERTLTLQFFAVSQTLELTGAIARQAVDLLTTIALPTQLTASDAIIASTAIEHSLPLYTVDPARFAVVPGLTTIQPY